MGSPVAAWRRLVTTGRWVVLGSIVGVLAGLSSAAFLKSLEWATRTREDHGWMLWLLPVAGFVVGLVYHHGGGDAVRGNNLLLDEIHEPGGGIPPRIVPLIFLTTVGGHLFGAPVGREGTAVQMGGGIAAAFARALSLSPARVRTLLMAGIAAGFGAVFGTPVAGAIFAIEVLAIGRFEYKALVPVLYAAFAADFTATAWGAHHTAYHIVAPGEGSLPFTAALLAKTAIAGIAFGLAALLFAEVAHGLAGFIQFDHVAIEVERIDHENLDADCQRAAIGSVKAALTELRRDAFRVRHKDGLVMEAGPASGAIEHIGEDRRRIVLALHELDHNIAPLAKGGAVIEGHVLAAIARRTERDVVRDVERAGAEQCGMLPACRANIRYHIGNLYNRQVGYHRILPGLANVFSGIGVGWLYIAQNCGSHGQSTVIRPHRSVRQMNALLIKATHSTAGRTACASPPSRPWRIYPRPANAAFKRHVN